MFRKLKVSTKLPLFVVGGAIAVGLGIGIASYETARFSLQEIGEDRLKASAEIARDEFTTVMESIERDLHTVAASPATIEALNGFTRAWNQTDDPTQTLQAAYIDNNPNPAGEKHLLDASPLGSPYDRVHASFHPWFRDLQQTNGYYDVFLFDTEGNLSIRC
jgi:methyl-accepting chemotaxis protein